MLSKMRFVALVFIIFSAIIGVSQAASLLNNFYCATNAGVAANLSTCINDTIPYVFVALLLSFALVAFSYLIGEVLNIQSFKGWYKAELWEAIKSLIIVGIIFSVIVIFGEVAALLPGGSINAQPGSTSNIDNLYQTGYYYLDGSPGVTTGYIPGVINLTNESFNNFLGASIGASYLESITLQTYFDIPFPPLPVPPEDPVPTFGSLNLGTDFNPFQSSIINTGIKVGPNIMNDILTYLIFPMLVVTGTELFLYTTLIQIGLGILLPLGLIFRATPFLRSIGGTLIALAIVAIIIYPALLAMLDSPINYFFSPLYTASTPANPGCSVGIPGFCQTVYNIFINPISTVFTGLPQGSENDLAAFNSGEYAATSAFFNGNISILLNSLFSYDVPVVIQFLLLILDLIIGIVAATNIAKILGGNIRLGIGKMKLT